jgi:hypothetical protein
MIEVVYSKDTVPPRSGKDSMLIYDHGDFGQVGQSMTLPGGTMYVVPAQERVAERRCLSDEPAGPDVFTLSMKLGQDP